LNGGIYIQWTAIIAGVLLSILGCNLQTEPPPQPEIVRKKIIVQPKPKSQIETKKPVAQKAVNATIQKVTETKPVTLPSIAKKADVSIPQKVLVPAERKIEQAVSQKITKKEQPKPDEKPLAKISEAAQKKLSGQDIPLYDPVGRIDPFDPLIRSRSESKPAEKKIEKRIPRTPLEKMDFSQMKLVAIVQSSKGNRALVEEASGKGYIISKGTYMGPNSGKVIQILNDRIVIEEAVENVLGEAVIKKRELKLQKPPGEL